MIRRFAWVILAWSSLIWLSACLSNTGSAPFQPAPTGDDAAVDSGYSGSTPKDGGGDATLHYAIGGTVSGLAKGATVVLSDNGGDSLTVSLDGAFTFATQVASGGAYAVTVQTQPTGPTETCTVTNGSGLATGNVTNVAVTCVTKAFTIGGTVKGLLGTGLVLENNNTDALKVSANGVFTFVTPIDSGNAFNVKVQSEPSGPPQQCSVSGGGGIVGSGAVTGVVVNCATDTFTVGGQISGLAGGTVVLQNNAGDNLSLNANGSFAFATPVLSAAPYAVTVLTEPASPSQTCTVTAGSGTVGAGNVSDVRVTCVTNAYAVRGTVTGLLGTGLVLEDNGLDNLTVTSNGAFTFVAKVLSGTTYKVTALTQPKSPTQFCAITNGSGTVGGADVANVAVACTSNFYTVGVTVSGLSGTGLVLEDNGGDDLAVSANGSATFATSVASGQPYAVTVKTNPLTPAQNCTVTGGSGTVGGGNVTGIAVNCSTDTFTVGGTVAGLGGATIVLQNNGGDDLTLKADGTFAFATPVSSGAPFAVTVLSSPTNPWETCVVTRGTGTVAAANVTNVAVTCTTNAYTIGGSVSGLSGSGLVLQDNGGDDLAVSANGTFSFKTPVASGAPFHVTVKSEPTNLSQTCTVTNAIGTVAGANLTSVGVVCATNMYTVGGSVTGLQGKGLVLTNNGGDSLPLSANGTFAFVSRVPSGATYSVAVSQNPSGPTQSCVVTAGTATGTVTSSNITQVAVTCTTQSFSVGGTVSGLLGAGLVLADNGGDSLSVTANGKFTFKTPVASGAAYNVTIQTQPSGPAQSCSVSSGQGTVGGGAVSTITVNCATNAYTVSGTVSGLSGTGLVLQDNGGDSLAISQNGQFSFATPVTSGGAYSVAVLTNPSNPTEQCTVTNGAGTVTNANVSGVVVTCTVSRFTVSGTVSGLAANESVVLQDNGADNLTVAANGTFTFTTAVPSNGTYAVTVLTNPSAPVAETCTVSKGSGTVGSAAVTTVAVSCAANLYAVGGTVVGLGAGDTLSLSNAGTTIAVTGNSFAFPAQPSGSSYSVTAVNPASPVAQSCTVANGSGTVGKGPVTSVVVTCTTDTFAVGGTVSGLAAGDTLLLSNGGATISVTSSTFTFAVQPSGSAYNVTATNPTSPVAQTCTVANASGTLVGASVTNVAVTCTTNSYTVGGTVTGLGAGDTLALANGNLTATVPVSGTTFTFPAQLSNTGYAVTVTNPTSPVDQVCSVTNGAGTVRSANVTNVAVVCRTNSYAVSGTISGLAAGDTLTITNGITSQNVTGQAFAFPAQASGSAYNVTATNPTSPIAQNCVVTAGSGVVARTNITNVTIACSTLSFGISGTVTGLAPGDTIDVISGNSVFAVQSPANTFSFAAQPSGTTFAIRATSPTSPVDQSCVVSNGSGTIGSGAVTNVVVTCTTAKFAVTGTITGLDPADSLTMSNGAGSTITASGSSFAFPAQPSGTSYSVTATNPASPISQTCTVAQGAGAITTAGVTNVAVTCTTNTFTVGGVVNIAATTSTGTVTLKTTFGTSSQVTNVRRIATDPLSIPFTFPTALPSGTTGTVTVNDTLRLSCTVTAGGTYTVGNSNYTGAVVSCQ